MKTANTARIVLSQQLWYLPILATYSGLVFFAASYHEPFYDEAQSWLIARDCDLVTMLREQLRYEGHPPLWYLILKCAIALGLPYGAINFLSAAIATVGAGLFLAKAPFPKWLSALMPFTFFFAFQFAVIARSYVLIPLLLFSVATLARNKWDKPFRWVIAVILLATVSLHTFLIAGGIVFVHMLEIAYRRRTLDTNQLRKQGIATAIYAISAVAILLLLWPSKNGDGATGLTGEIYFSKLFANTVNAVDSSFYGYLLATLVLLVASCYWFWRTGVLCMFLAVWIPVLAIFLTVRVAEQHYGILFFTWLFAVWVSVDAFVAIRKNNPIDLPLKCSWIAMIWLIIGLNVRQDIWTGCSIALEVEHPYCGAKSLALYIQSHDLAKYRVAVLKENSAAILPYFSKNFFANFPNRQGKGYVDYFKGLNAGEFGFNPQGVLFTPCDVIIWPNATSFSSDPNSPILYFAPITPPNWRFIGNFPGRPIFQDRFIFHQGFSLFVSSRVAEERGLTTLPSENQVTLAEICKSPELSTTARSQMERSIANEAMRFGNILVKIEPNSAQSQYLVAIEMAQDRLKAKDLREDDIQKWKQLESLARTNVATLIATDQPVEAIEQLRQAQQLDPRSATPCIVLGDILSRSGKPTEAVTEYQSAIRIYQNARRIDSRQQETIVRLQSLIESIRRQ